MIPESDDLILTERGYKNPMNDLGHGYITDIKW